MKRKVFLLIIVILLLLTKIETIKGQDSIKLKIIDYLITIGELDSIDNKKEYFNNVFIVDLLNYEEDEKREIGIFKFGTFADHSKSYLLLKEVKSHKILSLQNLDEDLLIELAFIDKNKVPPSEALKYIKATIILYQKNLKVVPWREY